MRIEHGQEVAVDGRAWVHDVHADSARGAIDLSHMENAGMERIPIGIFGQVDRSAYDEELSALLAGTDAWSVY